MNFSFYFYRWSPSALLCWRVYFFILFELANPWYFGANWSYLILFKPWGFRWPPIAGSTFPPSLNESSRHSKCSSVFWTCLPTYLWACSRVWIQLFDLWHWYQQYSSRLLCHVPDFILLLIKNTIVMPNSFRSCCFSCHPC